MKLSRIVRVLLIGIGCIVLFSACSLKVKVDASLSNPMSKPSKDDDYKTAPCD